MTILDMVWAEITNKHANKVILTPHKEKVDIKKIMKNKDRLGSIFGLFSTHIDVRIHSRIRINVHLEHWSIFGRLDGRNRACQISKLSLLVVF